MNKIKQQFSIKDLENLSGIKAHTIRIWEKRHKIFSPDRTETNIRFYSLEELKKLLNISFLNGYGYKISRIADYTDVELSLLVNQVYSEKTNVIYSINVLKVAMLNFDAVLFNQTYDELLKTKSFSDIFIQVYLPFLYEIGILWQTACIKPIHEHFICHLIFQKLNENISKVQALSNAEERDVTFVLFLPETEMHEISLLFINYQLLKKGYNTIYLGSCVPFSDLLEINKLCKKICYVSYFTINPSKEDLDDYLTRFSNELLVPNSSKLCVSGNQAKYISKNYSLIYKFDAIEDLIDSI